MTSSEALALAPALVARGLDSALLYYDAAGDDARVALTLARSAADRGADVATYLRAVDVVRNARGRIRALDAVDALTGERYRIATSAVVNATGVWADRLFQDGRTSPSPPLVPAKGVHLSVPRSRLPLDVAVVLPVPHDRRTIFAVPFEDAPFTFVGTTDSAYEGSLDEPLCAPEDVDYLLGAVNAAVASPLTRDDVTGVWAGLRPLLAPEPGRRTSERTTDLSRRHRIVDHHDGIVDVTGGKWTTYRQMAEDCVDALGTVLARVPHCPTRRLALHGVGSWRPTTPLETHLFGRFGDDARPIMAMIDDHPALAETAIAGLSYCGAELIYSAEHEMVTSLTDLLTRRTRAHLHDARATLAAAPAVARLVAPSLGWSDEECERQVDHYRQLVSRELEGAGLAL